MVVPHGFLDNRSAFAAGHANHRTRIFRSCLLTGLGPQRVPIGRAAPGSVGITVHKACAHGKDGQTEPESNDQGTFQDAELAWRPGGQEVDHPPLEA